jgi:hypothetical protein
MCSELKPTPKAGFFWKLPILSGFYSTVLRGRSRRDPLDSIFVGNLFFGVEVSCQFQVATRGLTLASCLMTKYTSYPSIGLAQMHLTEMR